MSIVNELKKELEMLETRSPVPSLSPFNSRSGGLIEIRGKLLVDFTSWDLFNLRSLPRIKFASQREIELSGFGSSASRLSSGTAHAHLSCEKRIATFLGCESSLLFSSKNQSILTLLAALVSEGDTILFDEQIQTPVSDAGYLMHAQLIPFTAASADSLAAAFEKSPKTGRRFVVFESLSAVTGRKAEIAAIFRIATRHDAEVIIDETLAVGTAGPRGAGFLEQDKILERPLCIIGSLSHSLASYGAFLAGSTTLVKYLISRSRTLAVESSPPPAAAAAAEAAVDYIEVNRAAAKKVLSLTSYLRSKLHRAGIVTLEDSDSFMICLSVRNWAQANTLEQFLMKKGYLAEMIPVGLPLNDQRNMRIIVNSSHTEKVLDGFADALLELYPKLSL